MSVLIVLPSAVFAADQVVADGDGLTPITSSTLGFGAVCPGTTVNKDVLIALKRHSEGNVFADSTDVSVTAAGTGVTATVAGTITTPAGWVDSDKGTLSPSTTSTVTLTVASDAAVGDKTGSVEYSATGEVDGKTTDVTVDTTMPVTWTVSTANCDKTAPTLSLPANITAEATSASGAAVTYSATSTDANPTNPTVTCNPASGSTFAIATTTVSCSATDAVGNKATGTFTVKVQDTTAPVVGTPTIAAVEATSASGAVVTYTTPSASDAVTSNLTVGCLPASGSSFALGTSTVTCSATDGAGNKGTSAVNVTVQDTTAPVLSLPTSVTAEATSAAGAGVSYTASASDAVSGNFTPNCNPASGSSFALGQTTVNCSATDGANNTATGSFMVTVQDTTKPVVEAVTDITGIEATSAAGAAVTFATPSATDAVTASLTVTCTPVSDSTFALGTTEVTCSATDGAGNTGSRKFNVTVVDTTAPALTLSADILLEATGPNGAAATFDPSPSAVDLVDGSVSVSCAVGTGSAAAAIASGSTFPLGITTINCSATDTRGNTATGSFTVEVEDTTAPEIDTHANVTAEATGANGATVTYNSPATSDVVDGNGTATCLPASGSTFEIGTTEVTCNATDAAGNKATQTAFMVIVRDTTAPTVGITLDPTVPNGSNGWYKSAVTLTVTANDAVGVTSTEYRVNGGAWTTYASPVTFNTDSSGYSVEARAADAAGNGTTTANPTNFKLDSTAPTNVAFIGGPTNGQSYTFGSVPAAPTGCTASDNLDSSVDCVVTGPATPGAVGTHTFTATATDDAGNQTVRTLSYTVNAWTLNGFYSPVDMSTATTIVWNTVKSGSTVPLKFEIFAGTTELTDVAAIDHFKVYSVAAPGTTAVFDDIELLTTGGTSLRYDTTAGQFIQNWQTPKNSAGKAYKVVMTTDDGSTITAYFLLK